MNENTQTRPGSKGAGSDGGFTLFELLIVIGIIVMIAGMAMPSILSLLTSGSDAQAYNAFSGQLTVARALAVENQTYVAIHCQLAQENAKVGTDEISDDAIYVAITRLRVGSTDAEFELMPGFVPTRVPGSIGFGEVSRRSINTASKFALQDDVEGFMSFSVIFSPQGEVVKMVNGKTIWFSTSLAGGSTTLWDSKYANGEEGISAIAMFDYGELMAMPESEQEEYLTDACQFLPINTYTGRLFSRDSRGQ